MPAKLSLHRYKCSYGYINKNYTFEPFNYTLRFRLFNTFYFNSSLKFDNSNNEKIS